MPAPDAARERERETQNAKSIEGGRGSFTPDPATESYIASPTDRLTGDER